MAEPRFSTDDDGRLKAYIDDYMQLCALHGGYIRGSALCIAPLRPYIRGLVLTRNPDGSLDADYYNSRPQAAPFRIISEEIDPDRFLGWYRNEHRYEIQ